MHKAIRTGRITPQADGTIDTERADAEWAKDTEAPNPSGTRHRAVSARVAGEGGDASGGGGTSLLQARTVNEVVKAQTNKVRLARLKGKLVDRNQAIAQLFKVARTERDAWLNWPVSAQMAAELGVDPHVLHVALESAVRKHLTELGEITARVE